MKVTKTGLFCLNSAITQNDETELGKATEIAMDKAQREAAVIIRIENFEMTDEQVVKIKEAHERHAAEIRTILGW